MHFPNDAGVRQRFMASFMGIGVQDDDDDDGDIQNRVYPYNALHRISAISKQMGIMLLLICMALTMTNFITGNSDQYYDNDIKHKKHLIVVIILTRLCLSFRIKITFHIVIFE